MIDNDIKKLSAYFFNIEYYDDPNIELTSDQIQNFYDETMKFRKAYIELILNLEKLDETTPAELIQEQFYNMGKQFFGEDKDSLRRFFSLIYMILYGKTVGPRFGVFANLFGLANFVDLMDTRFNEAVNWFERI